MRGTVRVSKDIEATINARIADIDDVRRLTERAAREVISLPVYPELTRSQLDRVIDVVRAFYR